MPTLASLAAERPLAPKWLIAPSRTIGYQWLESVVRRGQPVINYRVLTLRTLALEIAGPELARQNMAVVDATTAAMIVGRLWEETQLDYLNTLARTPNLDRAVWDSLHALRMAGLRAAEIQFSSFEVLAKGKDLQKLLSSYEGELARLKLVDSAGVLQLAIQRLQQISDSIPADAIILICDELEPRGIERTLLATIPKSQCHVFSLTTAASPTETDLQRFRQVLERKEVTLAERDGTVEIFRAIGPVNEIREVLRRCASERNSLDEVEVLYTDADTYVPLMYEIALSIDNEHSDRDEPPVTFAEGIPATYSRPGRALMAWITWISDGFLQQHLVRMVADGLLNLKADEQDLSFVSLAAMLRKIGIGWGQDRYLPQLATHLEQLNTSLAAHRKAADPPREWIESLERQKKGGRMLQKLVQQLLAISNLTSHDRRTLDSAIRFLESSARCVTKIDNMARERLVAEIDRLGQAIDVCEGRCSEDLLDWLKQLPTQVRLLESGPEPGKLHVAPLFSGGHSDRRHTFILGLDDTRFPGSLKQDPVLLDSERIRLSAELPLAHEQLEKRVQQFASVIGRLTGQLTLGYPCHDLADNRELFPSIVVLRAHRLLSRKQHADQRDLHQLPTVSFTADAPERVLNEQEWWLCQISNHRTAVGESAALELVHERFPHLKRGAMAAANRSTPAITAHDGFVPAAGECHDPTIRETPFSASALETLGQCSLKFFYQYPLGVHTPDELLFDPERWLDPLQFGSLLHEVFRDFLSELQQRNQLPEFDRDEIRLGEILNSNVASYRDRFPPPNEPAFRRQRRQLRRAARIFLRLESDFCRQSTPRFFEAAIGLTSEGTSSPLDRTEPVMLALPGGGRLRVRGRVDRIDQIAEHEYSIWDYKSGSSYGYEQSKPFQQGRKVQNAVYVAMVEQVLREKVDVSAAVASFGYFFPGDRQFGLRISWSRGELIPAGLAIIEQLCEIIRRGAFLPTDNKSDCEYCDYRPACGNIVMLTTSTKHKLAHPDNTILEPMRKLRQDGK